jgi:hypothetical protein
VSLGKLHDAREILEAIGFWKATVIGGVTSLIALIRWLAGRKITARTSVEKGVTRIEVDHTHHIDVSDRVMRLFDDLELKRDLKQVFAPLAMEGVSEFRTRKDDRLEERVQKDELDAFDVLADPASDDQKFESTVEKLYGVVTLSFSPKYIWRFTDGDSTITAYVDDEDFYQRCKTGKVSFAEGDLFRVLITSTTTHGSSGLHTENRVTKVLDVIHRAKPSSDPELPLSP